MAAGGDVNGEWFAAVLAGRDVAEAKGLPDIEEVADKGVDEAGDVSWGWCDAQFFLPPANCREVNRLNIVALLSYELV